MCKKSAGTGRSRALLRDCTVPMLMKHSACSPSATSNNVRSPADFQVGVAEAKKGGRTNVLLLVAHSQGGTGFVAIDIDKA